MAVVWHSFKDANFVAAAKARFQDGSVWRIKDVQFLVGIGTKQEYNPAPNKNGVAGKANECLSFDEEHSGCECDRQNHYLDNVVE